MGINLLFQIAGVGVLVTVLNMLLKRSEREEMAMLVTIAGLVVALLLIINPIAELFRTVQSIFQLY